MVSWCHGVMVSWCHGVMVSWCHGVMVSWCHGVMVSWCHGVVFYSIINKTCLAQKNRHCVFTMTVSLPNFNSERPISAHIFYHIVDGRLDLGFTDTVYGLCRHFIKAFSRMRIERLSVLGQTRCPCRFVSMLWCIQ